MKDKMELTSTEVALRIDPINHTLSYWQKKTETEYVRITQEQYFKTCRDKLEMARNEKVLN
ncbi:MAG TPA: hypothetical protein VGB63_13515 [Pedobacter sp.]|jgi:hypothetical protein